MSGRQDPQGGSSDEQDDEAAADAAMLSQEEALIVTNRLHQVGWESTGLGQGSNIMRGCATQPSPRDRCDDAVQPFAQSVTVHVQVLRPFMLRRLKETVASELPQKVRLHSCRIPHSITRHALFSGFLPNGWPTAA